MQSAGPVTDDPDVWARSGAPTLRCIRHCADTVYTVSSAADHYREQTKRGGFSVERAPDYANFTSALPHHPATTFRLKNDNKVPQWIARDYRGATTGQAELCRNSARAAVNGAHRYKHSQRPFLATSSPVVVINAPRRANDEQVAQATELLASRTIGTQSLFRESEAQTDPYSANAAPPAPLTLKERLQATLHHCGDVSELSHLHSLNFALGQKPGVADVDAIGRLRARRAFEATLPSLTDAAALPLRQKLLEEREQQEWDAREADIEVQQQKRLDLLEQAILTREAEVEGGNAERVRAKTDRLLAAKQGAFAAVQKERVKAIRHFGEARKCAGLDTFCTHGCRRLARPSI